MFSLLNKVLKKCRFGLNEDVKAVVIKWFHQKPKEFFSEGIH
jgi:hypothetical protein